MKSLHFSSVLAVFLLLLVQSGCGSDCEPACGIMECGPDPVCGESCGTCPDGKTCNSNRQCVTEWCVQDCSGQECGPDPVCGESCGTCTAGKTCNSEGQCVVEECEQDCSGLECGPDPVCAKSCGTCTDGKTCNSNGQCVVERCFKYCLGRECGPDPVCEESCGTCGTDEICDTDGKCISKVDTSVEWVRIEGGNFNMGSNDEHSYNNEKPVHSVTVPTFEMSKTEVTVDHYRACVNAGACTGPNYGGNCNWGKSDRGAHPINCVDWSQAQAFAKWAGGRLPSEAEWEYAARSGGRDWRYPWGNEEATCDLAVMEGVKEGCGRDSTWPVCSKPSGNTSQGLCDMAGNIWEWVQDGYHYNYEGAPSDGSAWESPAGSDRVGRGGSWLDGARYVRSARRGGDFHGDRYDYLGFRLVRSVF